ncbi:Gag-Pol polyprotein [Gossypium australe]|uniref:Gag-Pol polyprotein n=1 Tax=Gossypium australe TaxID=47621 RepID=A0A5B6VAF2_9ROSI|nr:Gag-Pol polyprotein [Gossypium australe]
MDYYNRSTTSLGYSNRDHGKQHTNPKAQATSVSSVGSVKAKKPECQQCGKRHLGDCWMNNKAYFRCGSKGATKDFAMRSEARATTRAYAIRACEDASAPDVIIDTFSLYDIDITALIDPGSTHSYALVRVYLLSPLKVSNPLGQYVLIDKVCKNCPLMTRGYCFSADLMLLPFDEFDMILGVDWLTLHDAVINCRRKTIELKC